MVSKHFIQTKYESFYLLENNYNNTNEMNHILRWNSMIGIITNN